MAAIVWVVMTGVLLVESGSLEFSAANAAATDCLVLAMTGGPR